MNTILIAFISESYFQLLDYWLYLVQVTTSSINFGSRMVSWFKPKLYSLKSLRLFYYNLSVINFVYISDPKNSNPLYTSFSVYTNGRRLITFTSNSGTMHCVDGIRALSMIWVVLGHSFSTENAIANPIALSVSIQIAVFYPHGRHV